MAATNGPDQGIPNEDQGPVILGATLTVTIAALMTMATRLYVRLHMIRNVGWDDYVMILAMLLCLAGQILIIPEVHLGAGRHIQHIDPVDFANGYKLNFITQPLYLYAICLVKISVGFFLLRIATQPFYRRIIISIMVFMGVYTTGCFFTIVLQCTNLAVQWDPNVKATCWSAYTIKTLSYVNVSFNIVTDVLFSTIIPIPLLWNLQMNKRQKSSLMCILGLGLFATAAAIVKASYISTYGRTGDWLWDSRNLTIWTVVESNIGIIAGNLPCLKPLFRVVLGSTYGRGSRAQKYNYGSRSQGVSAKHNASSKGWSTLSSKRTIDGESDLPRNHGPKQTFLLTTINAEHDLRAKLGPPNTNASGAEGASTGKDSLESLTRGYNGAGLGKIHVDTEVNVVQSHSPLDTSFENRRERKEMI